MFILGPDILRSWGGSREPGRTPGLFFHISDAPGIDAVGRYEEFVCNGISQGKRTDLVGGGLLRSAGG